jgi:phosphoribosylaminoimidazolecarboxamide formyltransferase/IMP cyclohydrolase
LSYNNYNDLESAFNIVNEFSEPACVIIKHANPCGFGIGDDLNIAYNRAVSTDPVSYFGGIVGFNRTIDLELAQELIKPFLECIIAPKISLEALEIFKEKKNLRILTLDDSNAFDNLSIKSSAGGFVIQDKDTTNEEFNNFDIVTEKKVNENQKRAMKIGWKIVKYVKSNAIVIANNQQVLGVGAGQMSRIDSLKIAIRKIKEAGLPLENSVLGSDAFFPFSDSIELAAENGISAVIQPGGSIKDEEVISKADELGMAMAMTGVRHFYH